MFYDPVNTLVTTGDNIARYFQTAISWSPTPQRKAVQIKRPKVRNISKCGLQLHSSRIICDGVCARADVSIVIRPAADAEEEEIFLTAGRS